MGFLCCRQKIVEEQLLTDIQKDQNPFRSNEKIIYYAGDSTIVFTGTGRNNWTEEYDVDENYCEYGFMEFDRLIFTGNSFNITLYMRESKYYFLGIYDSINNISFYSRFIIDKTTGSISDYNELIDRFNINDIPCFEIYKDTLFGSNIDMPDSVKLATYLYYSTEYGIVKFDFSDGSTWELKEIIW